VAILWITLLAIVYYVYAPTAKKLFTAGSIVDYWRTELGGNPDADDPYNLQVPAACFEQRLRAGRLLEAAAQSTNLASVSGGFRTDTPRSPECKPAERPSQSPRHAKKMLQAGML
jgi:hypothetical protein